MPLAEKFKNKITEKSKKTENAEGVSIDSMEWLLLFLGAGFIDILFILLAIIGLIPFVGQAIYAIVDPVMNIVATGIFWFYLQNKGLGSYWWLAFGGGLAGLVPVVNWFSWVVSIMVFYFLTKAEKIPLAGEAIEKAAKVASKIK